MAEQPAAELFRVCTGIAAQRSALLVQHAAGSQPGSEGISAPDGTILGQQSNCNIPRCDYEIIWLPVSQELGEVPGLGPSPS